MLTKLWNTLLYAPLYNLLVVLIVLFGGSAGLAIVALTIVVKVILLPFTAKTIKSQLAMKAIEPKLQKIREEHATDKKLQTQKTFELYKDNKVNPFTGCLLLIIQLPVIIALYRVVLAGFEPHSELLYKAVNFPQSVSTMFLGLNITEKSIILAVIIAILQFIQVWLSTKSTKQTSSALTKVSNDGKPDMQKIMQTQMKYFLPVMVGVITYTLPAAIGIYWAVNIILTIIQEYYIRGKYTKVYESSN